MDGSARVCLDIVNEAFVRFRVKGVVIFSNTNDCAFVGKFFCSFTNVGIWRTAVLDSVRVTRKLLTWSLVALRLVSLERIKLSLGLFHSGGF